MSVVSSTARMRIGPQDITELSRHPFAHVKERRDRRTRMNHKFKRAVLRNPLTRIVYLIYASGVVVMLGGRSEAAIARAGRWLCRRLKAVMLEQPVISNVVYVVRHNTGAPARAHAQKGNVVLPTFFRLEDLYDRLRSEYVETSFEPELSPAVIMTPKCAARAKIMIFRTGNVNITGLRSFQAIDEVLQEMYTRILTG